MLYKYNLRIEREFAAILMPVLNFKHKYLKVVSHRRHSYS